MTDFQFLINNSIKQLRLSKNLSQEKFAEFCHLNTDNYRNIEYNRHTPKASTINKICDAFKITPVELLYFGIETSNSKTKEQIISSLNNLSEKQLKVLLDVIKTLKKY